MHGLKGMERQEREAEPRLGERGGRVSGHVAKEHGNRLRPLRSGHQRRGNRQELRRQHDHRGCRPGQRRPGQQSPAADEQQQQRRGHEAPSEVVENLPSADQRQPVAFESATRGHEGKQPEQDLPVASDPPVLATRVRENARRVLVNQFDVRHQRDTGMKALEQIVREESVIGHLLAERRVERVHVVESLAGEDPFAEQILIGVRHRRGVRIYARMPGIEAREQRAGSAGICHADAWLEDAVPFGDASELRVERRSIEGMRDHPNEFFRRITRQPRVAVERDAIADCRENAQISLGHDEARIRRASEQPVELFDLAALAFPPHPEVFPRIPLPLAMKEEEPVGGSAGVRIVQATNARTCGVKNRTVAWRLRARGVAKVGEQSKVQ